MKKLKRLLSSVAALLMVGAVILALAGAGCNSCFPPGTKILMADGSLKNIEDVRVGEWVMGYDGEKMVPVKVLEVESPIRGHMCTLHFADGSTLRLTEEHPVYTEDGWKSISPKATAEENAALLVHKLRPGDKVLKSGGGYAEITEISYALRIGRTYNLKTVSGCNNFFAGGFLAHNKTSDDDDDDDDGDDGYEENDTRGTAWDFSGGEGQWLSSYGGESGRQYDDDWYEIYVTTDYTRVVIDCQFSDASGDIDIQLVDASGVVLASSNSTSDDEYIDHDVAGNGYSGGTFYIRVHYDDAGNSYDLWWDDLMPSDPDLIVTDCWWTGYTDTSVTFDWEVYNQGSADAGPFRVGFCLSTDTNIEASEVFYYYNETVGLNSGVYLGDMDVTLPFSVSAGSYYLGVYVDYQDVVSESNEGNNTGYDEFPITINDEGVIPMLIAPARVGADLVVTGLDWKSYTPTSVTLDWEVLNQGTDAAGPFRVGFYLSADTKITKADIRFAACEVSSLAAGARTGSDGATYGLDVPDGVYYLGAVADDRDEVAESKEDNNARSDADLVSTAP